MIAARSRSGEGPTGRLPRRAFVLALAAAAWSVFVVVIEINMSRQAMTDGPDPDGLSLAQAWGGVVVALVAMVAALVACGAMHRARPRAARWALMVAAIAGLLGFLGAVLCVLALLSLPGPDPVADPGGGA